MRVIPPINTTPPWLIKTTMLSSSTIAEPSPGEVAWVSGTTYATGDVRIVPAVHRKFLRLGAGAGTISPELDTANWKDDGPTNKWAMFDALRNSATEATGSLTVSIAPAKRVNSIAVMGMLGDLVSISMSVNGFLKYSYSKSLILRRTTSWKEYLFGEFGFQPSLILFDLPPYSGATISITISGSGVVKCGAVVVGTAVNLGTVLNNPEVDSNNFSKILRDEYGGVTLIPIPAIPKTAQILVAEKDELNKILETKKILDAVPAVWSGLDDKSDNAYFESLLILGIWKKFTPSLKNSKLIEIDLQLEEI